MSVWAYSGWFLVMDINSCVAPDTLNDEHIHILICHRAAYIIYHDEKLFMLSSQIWRRLLPRWWAFFHFIRYLETYLIIRKSKVCHHLKLNIFICSICEWIMDMGARIYKKKEQKSTMAPWTFNNLFGLSHFYAFFSRFFFVSHFGNVECHENMYFKIQNALASLQFPINDLDQLFFILHTRDMENTLSIFSHSWAIHLNSKLCSWYNPHCIAAKICAMA